MNSSLIIQPMIRILLIEDNPGDVLLVKEHLKYSGIDFELTHSATLNDAISRLSNERFNVILLDLGLPDSLGIDTLKKINLSSLEAPVIVMTGLDDEKTAIASLKEGVQDYLFKNNLNSQNIIHSIRYSIERKKIQDIERKNARQFSALASATTSINETEKISEIFKITLESISLLLNEPNVFSFELSGIHDEDTALNAFGFPEEKAFSVTTGDYPVSDALSQNHGNRKDIQRPPEAILDCLNKLLGSNEDKKLINSLGYYINNIISELIEENSEEKIQLIIKNFQDLFDKITLDERVKNLIRNSLALKNLKVNILILSRNHNKYGCIVIFTTENINSREISMLEIIGNQASLSIHRRKVEKNLIFSENRYRILNKELEERVLDRTKDLAKTNQLLEEELSVRIRLETELIQSRNELEQRVKERTAELAKSEERFHKMFYNHEAVMLLVNPENGTIVEANRSAKNFYGHTFSNSEQRTVFDINVYPGDEINENIKNAVSLHQNYFILPQRLASGEERIVEVYTSPIEMVSEKLLFAIIHDITERTHMEIALKESEVLYKTLVNNSLNIILISVNNIIEFTNEAASHFIGLPQQELIGRNIDELFKFSLLGMEEYSLAGMIAESVLQNRSVEIQIFDKTNDASGYFIVRSNVIQYKGKEAIMSIFTDITENKNIEKYVLKKVIETEENDRKQFAADLHDDLGPILSAIKLRLDLMENMKSSAELKENIAISNELTGLVVDKIRSISHSITPHLIETLGLDAGVRDLCKRITELNKIDIRLESDIENKRFSQPVELHFYRIISELINNSLKHSNASLISISLLSEDDKLELNYFDNGKGYNSGESLQKSGGIGLHNILNRVNLINATINFSTRDGKTYVKISKKTEPVIFN